MGKVLAGYRVLSLMQLGGISALYLAVQDALDRRVVLKVPYPELAADPGYRRARG